MLVEKISQFIAKNKVFTIFLLAYFVVEIIYMRFCQTTSKGYPMPGWNFLVKENGHIHIIILELVILYYTSTKIIKTLILTDILYCIQKTIVQIVGLIYAGTKSPSWCNQRMIGFFLSFGIILIITYLNWEEFTLILNKLSIKIKTLWLRIFTI